MKCKTLLLLIALYGASSCLTVLAQQPKVGVNTKFPTQSLDVDGKVRVLLPRSGQVGYNKMGVIAHENAVENEQGLLVEKPDPVGNSVVRFLFRVQNQIDPNTQEVVIDDEITDADLGLSVADYDVMILSSFFTNTLDWNAYQQDPTKFPRVPCLNVGWSEGSYDARLKLPQDLRDLRALYFLSDQAAADQGKLGYANRRAWERELHPINSASKANFTAPIIEVYPKNGRWHLQADYAGRPFFLNYTQPKGEHDAFRKVDPADPILRGNDQTQGLWVMNLLIFQKTPQTPDSEIRVLNFYQHGNAGEVLK